MSVHQTMDQEPPSSERDLLREFLAHRDAPCPFCGYNLRGLTGPACPECAGVLRLDVARAREGPWPVRVAVAGLVVYTVASAFSAASGAYTMWTLGAFGPPTSPLGLYLAGEVFGTALGTTGLVRCWIRRRRGDAGRTALCWTAGVLLAWAIWAIGSRLLWLVVF